MAIFANEQLRDRLTELARRAADRDIAVTTRFLSPEEGQFALGLGAKVGAQAALFGGFDGAERCMCCYCGAGSEPQFPLCFVDVTWRGKTRAPAHRELLGSVLALGMDRSFVGDIAFYEGGAIIIATQEMAALIADSLLSAGSTPVDCRLADKMPAALMAQAREVTDTVASLRLDNVLASGLRTSRGKAVAWIEGSKVYVNHELCERADKQLKQGDVLSVRGVGRIQLQNVSGPTKKGRIPITLAIF